MPVKAKRSEYAFYYLESGRFFNVEKLLAGKVELRSVSQVLALSILQRREFAIPAEHLAGLCRVPSDKWIPERDLRALGLNAAAVRSLAAKGLLLLDRQDAESREMRRREEILSAQAWNIYAALFHFLTRWRDIQLGDYLPQDLTNRAELTELEAKNDEAFLSVVERYGPPPPHFFNLSKPRRVQSLPLVEKSGQLYEALRQRKTTRALDGKRPLSLRDFSTLLYYVWGCHGYTPVVREDIVAIKRTSPSGGGLHPVECYPLVVNVDGVKPGIYHYSARDHSLELLESVTQAGASAFANQVTAGQSYPRYAGALFIMTARFYRNFWKYRRHNKAYMAILMDAAHLSQTFYMICADLGLGAFVTGAINSQNIEERLKLDGFQQGPVLVVGCGVKAEEAFWEPSFRKYVPGRTRV